MYIIYIYIYLLLLLLVVVLLLYAYIYIIMYIYIVIRFVCEITFDLGDSLTISVKATISDRRFLLWRGNDHDGCIIPKTMGLWWFYGVLWCFNGIYPLVN